MWSPFSADEELGYVYLPVESATGDFYGGHRPGNNLFAGSLVCLDARTGKRVWHQQLVHHDIWDYDLASPPTLINITVNGKPIRAVAQVTKWGYLFAFDRVNGTPVWPIEERKVEAGTVPGEWYAPTQPHPTKPAPYDRQGVSEADLIDFTPELNAEARAMLKEYKIGPLFTPPIVAGTDGLRGNAADSRGAGRGALAGRGVGSRNEHAVCAVGDQHDGSRAAAGRRSLRHELHRRRWRWRRARRGAGRRPRRRAPTGTDPEQAAAARGAGGGGGGGGGRGGGRGGAAPALGPGASRGPWGMGPQGLPLVKPPYGRITAYNMNTGDIVWQVANGDTYDGSRRTRR